MRLTLTLAGILTLCIVWSQRGTHSFQAHMAVHMSVVAVAAPLIAWGIAGTSLDPVRRAPAVFSALIASLVELAVVWIWHTPVFHAAARESTAVWIAEQVTFLLSALLWISVFGGGPEMRKARSATGIAALLLTVMHMTLLGALLALSPRPYMRVSAVTPGLAPSLTSMLGERCGVTKYIVSFTIRGAPS